MFSEKLHFCAACPWKKNLYQKSGEKWKKKKRKNTVNFSIFSKNFQSFWKIYVSMSSEREKKSGFKSKENPKKPLQKGLQEIVEKKKIKNWNFGRKRTLSERRVCRIYESVKNSVLKAISDETL